MEGRRLVFADETVIEGEAGYADGVLVCFCNLDFSGAYMVFGDSAKTRHIVFEYGEMADTYDGYTEVVYITTGDRTAVGLRRPEGWNTAQ